MTGNYSTYVNFYVGGTGYIRYGTKNKTQNKDEFGNWHWNDSHTKIWLTSTNFIGDTLVLNIDSNKIITMTLCFSSTKVSGEGQNDGIETFSFRFGEKDITLPFIQERENRAINRYKYGVYNRFLNEWNFDATSIVDQIIYQTEMLIEYTEGDLKKTAIYELEGLELIMGYIKAQ